MSLVPFVIVACVAHMEAVALHRHEAEVVLRFVGLLGIEIRVVWRGRFFGVVISHCRLSAIWMFAKSAPHDVNVPVAFTGAIQIVLSDTEFLNSHIRSLSEVASVLQGPGTTGRR